MGAWGLGLFESNHDQYIVDKLDAAANLLVDDFLVRSLYDKALKSGEALPGKLHKTLICKKSCGHEVFVYADANFTASLYARASTSPMYTRHRIEKCPSLVDPKEGSEVQRLIAVFTAETTKQEASSKPLKNPFGAAYKLVILGACLMTLGCTLPDSFLALLKATYPKVGLMRNAVQQMAKAFSPEGFKNGWPYDFGSLTREEQVSLDRYPPFEDRIDPYTDLLNVPSPDEAATDEMLEGETDRTKSILLLEKAKIEAIRKKDVQACKICAAGKCRDGSPLRSCKNCCKMVKYCSKECWTADLPVHNVICKGLEMYAKRGYRGMFMGARLLPSNWREECNRLSDEGGKLVVAAEKLKEMLAAV